MAWAVASRRDQATHSRVFIGPKGAHLRWSNFARSGIGVSRGGLTHIGVRDLRHTGNVLAAETGATLRQLMDRMGHSTTRAALIYQHARAERDRAIVGAIGKRITAARQREAESPPAQARIWHGTPDPPLRTPYTTKAQVP